MKAWTLVSPRKMELITKEPTELTQPNTAKVKIERALLSASDYERYDSPPSGQHYPMILGRYGVGIVSKITEESTEIAKADRVVITPSIPCQECRYCQQGKTQKCENPQWLGINTDGIYRDFIDLPLTALYTLPESVSFEKALFTGYISFALNILDSLKIEKGDHIAIFSETKVDLIISQLITYYGAVPVLVDKDDETLKMARELGIFYTFNYADNPSFKDDMFNITSGRMCEKVIYLTNSHYPLSDMLDISAYGADICLALNTEKTASVDLAQITTKQIHLYSVNTCEGNFPAAINFLATNKIKVECLLGGTAKFSELDRLIEKQSPAELRRKNLVIDINK